MACDHRNFARSPIRVWHVDATTILRGNVVDSAQQGFLLECRAGDSAGCADGTILLQDNTVAGGVRNLAGAMTNVNTTAGVLVFTGLHARVTIADTLFAMLSATPDADERRMRQARTIRSRLVRAVPA